MSSSNGTISLKSFADLARHIDVDALPPGPMDADPIARDGSDHTVASSSATATAEPDARPPQDLASVLAQLADASTGLEAAARQDARAREQATIELARYETLAAA